MLSPVLCRQMRKCFNTTCGITSHSSPFLKTSLSFAYFGQMKMIKMTCSTVSIWLQMPHFPAGCFPMRCKDEFSLVCPSLILLVRHCSVLFFPTDRPSLTLCCLPSSFVSHSFCHCELISFQSNALLVGIATSTWFIPIWAGTQQNNTSA